MLTNTKLMLLFGSYEFEVPILATFEKCTVKKLELSPRHLKLSYVVGDEPLQIPMPQVTQTPDCNENFDVFEVKNESIDKLIGVVQFDE